MTQKKSHAGAGIPASSPSPVLQLTRHFPQVLELGGGQVELPEVKAPSTEGLEVTVPAPPPLSEEDLLRRFHELARSLAESRDRRPGEEVAMGDDVQLDTLGYTHGQLLPFSIRTGIWMELAPQETLPGFAEAIEGAAVGDSVNFDILLPDDYPVESLRGVTASFIVDIRAAREVRVPDTDSDEFLRRLGRGSTHEEVMDALANELLDEQSDVLWLEAQNLVLEQLASRAEVQLPTSLVDEEIRRRWQAAEGQVLEQKDFSPAEKQEALDVWMNDPATRSEVERRLRIALALKAVAARDGLQLPPGKTFEVLEDSAVAFGLTPAQLREAMVDPESASHLQDVAWHLLAVEHVMGMAQVHFEGA